MNALFHAFPALLKEFGRSEEVCQALVFAAWRRIAGELLAEHTEPIGLDEKRLVIAVSDATWKLHLEDLSGQMIFKLNAALGSEAVTFLEYRVDEKKLRGKSHRKGKAPILEVDALEEVPPQLSRSAGVIRNENLRHNFLLAAGRCLARKKTLGKQTD